MSGGTLNRVVLIGNLLKDPEVKTTKDGGTMVTMFVATNHTWPARSGGRKERTDVHRVVAFGTLAEMAERNLSKGSRVFAEGMLCTRRWIDQSSGSKTFVTEVLLNEYSAKLIFLDKRVTQTDAPSDVDDDLDAAPKPLTVTRSAGRYGDDLSDAPDVEPDVGLQRFLSASDDADRRRRRDAADPERRNA